MAAKKGDSRVLLRLAKNVPSALNQRDENGWLPLHEVVRSGHMDALHVLLTKGIDINSVTKFNESPLNIAKKYLGDDHDVTKFLVSFGAVDIGPEL